MRGLKALAALVSTGALLVAVAPATADAGVFRHYVSCGLSQKAKPKHVCPKRSRKGAFFSSKRGRACLDPDGNRIRCVYYKVCVQFPTKRRICANRQQAEKGTLYVNRITSNIPGKHKVTWFVRGKRVGRFIFRVKG